jgi:hypothetical protein
MRFINEGTDSLIINCELKTDSIKIIFHQNMPDFEIEEKGNSQNFNL